jgi:hypothetical protein
VGLLAFLTLFFDGVVVHVFLAVFLNVEAFEKTVEVEMLDIIRAKGKFRDD